MPTYGQKVMEFNQLANSKTLNMMFVVDHTCPTGGGVCKASRTNYFYHGNIDRAESERRLRTFSKENHYDELGCTRKCK